MSERQPKVGEAWTGSDGEELIRCPGEADSAGNFVWVDNTGYYAIYHPSELRPPVPPRPPLPEPEVRYWTIDERGGLVMPYPSLGDVQDHEARRGKPAFAVARETTTYEWVESADGR